MPSQFFGLNIAYTGLLASNASMNTTANNIANVQTEGYSRQHVTQQAANALRIFQTYGCAGAGVETLAVERIRDDFYDQRFWSNNSRVGEYEQLQYYMTQVESYFDDNGKNAGFKTVFDQLMITGMEELLKFPSSVTHKEQFVGYAGSLAEYFNGVAGNLEKVQKDVNEEIKVKVDEINSIASEIAALNKQINTIELSGPKANELRDRRTLLVDELSKIVDVDVKETSIADTNNPDRNTGGTRFMVRISGGQILVDGNDYNELECVSRTPDEKVNQTDADGLYDIYWKGDGSRFNLYGGAVGGALRGLMQMRDGNNGEYFHGVISEVDSKANTVTVDVGQHYLTDLNKCNLSDKGGVINLGNREYYYDSWTYEVSYDDNGNASYSYTFQLSTDKALNPFPVTNDREGKTASVGTDVSYQGVPYYMAQMNEWVRTFSQKFNDILVKGYSGDIPGIELFTANMTTENGQFVFSDQYRYDGDKENYQSYKERVNRLSDAYRQALKDAQPTPPTGAAIDTAVDAYKQSLKDNNPAMSAADIEKSAEFYRQGLEEAQPGMNDAAIDAAVEGKKDTFEKAARLTVTVGKNVTGNDSYYLMTSKNFAISSTIEKDPGRLANKTQQGEGVDQDDLLKLLQKMAIDKDKMSFRGSSASEFLQSILADVALNMSRAETFYESFSDISYTIDTQRLSISGVDEDEEAVNLVRFQNGYNLASKMIQTLTEVYDRLILQTGV